MGCEFADVFNAFGTQVTLIEVAAAILPVEDAEVTDVLAKAFKQAEIDVITGAQVASVEVGKDGVTIALDARGEEATVTVEKVLVATGRAPNIENIGLEEAGVKLTDRGFIKVDGAMQTTAQGVYAIGDVAGPPMLAHKGSREGVVAAEAIAGQKPHPIDYGNVPGATYCHPEVATHRADRGALQGAGARVRGGPVPVQRQRARAHGGRDRGLREDHPRAEVRRDPRGAHRGAHATELIHELAVARANEYTVEEIELAIHAHPTLAESVAQAALDSMGRMTDA